MIDARSFAILLALSPIAAAAQEPATGTAPSGAAPADTIEVPPNDYLNAVLWYQTSAEYEAAARTAYAMAKIALDRALADPSHTAAEEQTNAFSNLPPAIIMDVDETVLDNGPFQGSLIKNEGGERPADMWARWVEAAIAVPVPGADDFIAYAQAKGVTVFFITNRNAEKEEATRRNLAKIGAVMPADLDTVLLEREKPEWRNAKSPRRAQAAETHRILLLLGDDLGDFSGHFNKPAPERKALARQDAARWGRDWIMIPNPMYGSWEMAAINFAFRQPPDVRRQMKYDAIETAPAQ
ncbi:MAG: HAD family acid phosphatase [Rhodospirillaceae bacterium]|nr:HAD family acid phosphatase [Rhodospirillaceae bacterium]